MKNSERVIIDSVRRYCEPRGIDVTTFSHDWIMRLGNGDQIHHVFGYDLGLNSSSTLRICNDKCATHDVLANIGLASVPHSLFLHPRLLEHVDMPGSWPAMLSQFETYGRDVVLKNNEGTSGLDVFRSRTQAELELHGLALFQYCRTLAMSPFLDIGDETRFVILNGTCLFAYGKERPHVIGDGCSTVGSLLRNTDAQGPLEVECDLALVPAEGERVVVQWRHNLGLGAQPYTLDLEAPDVADRLGLAKAAMQAVGARFGSVDIVRAGQEALVLEINSGVMLEYVWSWHPEGIGLVDRVYHAALAELLAG